MVGLRLLLLAIVVVSLGWLLMLLLWRLGRRRVALRRRTLLLMLKLLRLMLVLLRLMLVLLRRHLQRHLRLLLLLCRGPGGRVNLSVMKVGVFFIDA
mmetsp:Transcript_82234/g.133459  ORF Transcript_82234/g.133459 Transcript_82234/m.133459 type:complete len:97 (-) Transcript_82234:3347-3637(-)